ncbi:MAG: nucleoid-associated protein [Ichthyobacteriaceae bacterium]|nr:nucleoid-associated protein [Ichthyobacteriaceae bacterium]
MLNLWGTSIEEMSVHQVGNKSKEEGVYLSESTHELNTELISHLNEFFFKPFRDKEESYNQFYHDTDISFNELYNLAKGIFNAPESFHEYSKKIAEHLYSVSDHPHIIPGEIYITLLNDITLDNQPVQAIGIFKSEVPRSFMKFLRNNNSMIIDLDKGVYLEKLDKGAIIFNIEEDSGYKVLHHDSNRYDAKYWIDSFLNITPKQDGIFHTKTYLKLCEDFSNDVVFKNEDQKEQIKFLNKSVDFFAKNDEFVEDDFINNVIDNPSYQNEFKDYTEKFKDDYKIEDFNNFAIANDAVTTMRRKFKNVINLDTNFEIKLNFTDENSNHNIEKGYDEEREMYYYLVYFNEEKKK